MHVLVRYEIEKGLFNGIISTEGLNETWNKMYKEYLGVDVPNDKVGILQDVHWSDGSFGYFPTYALGTAFAAQYMHAMRKDLDVDTLLSNNQYDVIMNWLLLSNVSTSNSLRIACMYCAANAVPSA